MAVHCAEPDVDAPPAAMDLVSAMCRCELSAIAEWVGRQSPEQDVDLLQACAIVRRAIFRARWRSTSAMMVYKLPSDPLQYRPATPEVLKQLLNAGSEGNEDAAFACVATLDLPDLDSYAYIASIVPLVVRQYRSVVREFRG